MSDPEKTEEEELEKALDETPTATPAEETLPDDEASPVVEQPDAPDPGADQGADPAADPAADPVVDPEADPKPDAEAKALEPAKRKPRTEAQKEKRKADAARRKQAIADAPRPPDPSEEDEAEQKRKADIREKMAETQGEIDELDAATEEKKDELRALSAELYPHLTESDHHTVAVKGYIESQKKVRATRASNPQTLKRLLAEAGKAPIDAAMTRKRARGQQRPTRPAAGVTPGNAAAPE